MIMEKINVTIDWSGNNYTAFAQEDKLNGVVAATHKTLEGVKTEFESALQFHVKGCMEDGDVLPKWISSGNYELNYELEIPALLHSLDGVLTRSAIARVSGINAKLIGHYASGYRKPRPRQRKKIIDGIHEISRELASVV
jgi:predicted RNase H-like HicB family nuclease